MPESAALAHRICKVLFEKQKPEGSYEKQLVLDPGGMKLFRLDVEVILAVIEDLGLSVADLNLYTPKRRLRMSKAGPRMRAQGKLKQEVRNTPQRLTDQTRRRKRN